MKKDLNAASAVNELKQSAFFRKKPIDTQPPEEKSTQKVTHNSTQMSKRVSNRPSKNVSNRPSTEDVEELVFRLRKRQKVRANADIPVEWKKLLDVMALELDVGKYDVVVYAIAKFLGKI